MATQYTFTDDNGIWKDTRSVSSSGNHTYRIKTNSTFVNKNIELTVNVPAASPSFTGGALNNKSASATFTNMTTSSTNTSGVAILAKGTAGRAAVTYNGAVNGWVNKSSGDTASGAVSASTWDGTTYYATGVTLGNGKQFDITVPNGNNETITFHFSVDDSGNTTVT